MKAKRLLAAGLLGLLIASASLALTAPRNPDTGRFTLTPSNTTSGERYTLTHTPNTGRFTLTPSNTVSGERYTLTYTPNAERFTPTPDE